MPRQIYHLKVTLDDTKPAIWRRIAVPGAYTLDRLHRVIQLAMGWQNCHLHSFEVNSVQYGEPDPHELMDMRDEIDVRLDSVVTKDSVFTYVYDFGDWWEHQLIVEEVRMPEADTRYPYCVDGVGVCPPEDVGGAAGFRQYLEALADESHADHAQMVEWYGRLHPRMFDPDRVSAVMRQMA